VQPPVGVSLDAAPLRGFLEGLAEALDVMALEPRPLQGPSWDGWSEDLGALLDALPERWPPPLPLTLCGIAEGAAPVLATATRSDVNAVVVVDPLLPAGASDLLRAPALAAKPLFVVLPQEGPGDQHARLDDTAWPRATWLRPPGDTEAFLRGAFAPGVAAWALGASRVKEEHSVLSSDAPRTR